MGYIYSLGSMVFLTFSFVGYAQTLPDGKGKAEFERICSGCHAVDVATSQRMAKSEWAGVVDSMVGRGAQGSPEELDEIVSYLAANFGKGNPAAVNATPAQPAEPTPPPSVAQKQETPLSETEVSKAKELIQANGCLSCHRIGDTGSYVGPYLSNVGAHRSPEQLHASLVSPNKEVLPENRTVRLVTSDRKTVTGRLLTRMGSACRLSTRRVNSCPFRNRVFANSRL